MNSPDSHHETDTDAHASHQTPILPFLERDRQQLTVIEQHGGWQKYTEALGPRIADAFYPPEAEKCAACMDEGDEHTEVDGVELHEVRWAGSGILDLNYPSLEAFLESDFDPLDPAHIDRTADRMIAEGITVIQSHGACGAGKIALMKHLEKAKSRKLTAEEQEAELTSDAIDAFVQKFSEILAAAMRQKLIATGRAEDAKKIRTLFKPAEKLTRPASHIAQVFYEDDTNAFRRPPDYPQGYVLSAKGLTSRERANTKKLAAVIDFGAHGPGDLLTPETPLHYVDIVSPADAALTHDEVNQLLADQLAPKDRERVRFDKFIPPLSQ